MTREEAIEVLKEYRTIVMYHLEAETPAFDMAIEALSADVEIPSDKTVVHIETYRKLYEKYVKLKHASADRPTHDDLISRADAVEAIMKHHDGGLNQINYGLTLAKNEIQALPSADAVDVNDVTIHYKPYPSAEAEWIPCNERLPSEDEYVIVSVLDDHGDTPWKYTTVAWLCNGVWISDNEILCGTAVAWMPLPKPYKTKSEVEK